MVLPLIYLIAYTRFDYLSLGWGGVQSAEMASQMMKPASLSARSSVASGAALRARSAAPAKGRAGRLAVAASSNNESRYGACWPGRVEVYGPPALG